MAAYTCREFGWSVSDSKTATGPGQGSILGSKSACSVEDIGVYLITVDSASASHTSSHKWSEWRFGLSVIFFDADDTVVTSAPLGGVGDITPHSSFVIGCGRFGANGSGGPITQCAIAFSWASMWWASTATATASASGRIRVYSDEADYVEGEKDAGMVLPAIVNGGKAGKTITRLRYKVTASMFSDQRGWSATPRGDTVWQFG